jgi:hypothetical protein
MTSKLAGEVHAHPAERHDLLASRAPAGAPDLVLASPGSMAGRTGRPVAMTGTRAVRAP